MATTGIWKIENRIDKVSGNDKEETFLIVLPLST